MLRCCKSEHFQERDPSCLWVAFATSWSQPYDAEAPVEPYNPIHWIFSNYIPGQSWRGSCLFSLEFISESFGRPGVKGLSTFLVPLMWNMWSQSNVETVIAHWLLFVMFIEAERVDEKIVSWRISCNSWITATTRHVATRVGSFRNGLLKSKPYLICLFPMILIYLFWQRGGNSCKWLAHTAFDSDRVEGKLGSVEPSSGGWIRFPNTETSSRQWMDLL